MIDIATSNQQLQNYSAQQIMQWAINLANKPIITTNFAPYEAVILHMATQVKADIPVIWIDSGYNTRDTYKIAEQLIKQLNLNVFVYTPLVTAARCDSALGGIPTTDDPRHQQFTEQFKLEPFNRALKEQAADLWLTAVRREQTEFRQKMSHVEPGPHNMLKVSPLLDWTQSDMQTYLEQHHLPNISNYFDPTKGDIKRECGLHTQL